MHNKQLLAALCTEWHLYFYSGKISNNVACSFIVVTCNLNRFKACLFALPLLRAPAGFVPVLSEKALSHADQLNPILVCHCVDLLKQTMTPLNIPCIHLFVL